MTKPDHQSGRNTGLDGLRGLAALSVALGHSFLQVTGLPLWQTKLADFPSMPWPDIGLRVFSVFFPGDAAVMVFFVLSGHVLWGSFARKQSRFFADLPDYVSARIYRLFPLVIVSCMALGLLTTAPAAELVRNMLLLSRSLNGVLWSLQVEVVASLALFVTWGLTRGGTWRLLAVSVVAVGSRHFLHGILWVECFPAFLLGALVTSVPARVWQNRWLLAGGTAILIFTNILTGHAGIARWFEMAGATALVGAVANGALGFMRTGVPLFLGAISYPFYLMHGVGLAGAVFILAHLPQAPLMITFAERAAVSIALTLPMAWLLHVFVEEPVLRARPRIGWASVRPPLFSRGREPDADRADVGVNRLAARTEATRPGVGPLGG